MCVKPAADHGAEVYAITSDGLAAMLILAWQGVPGCRSTVIRRERALHRAPQRHPPADMPPLDGSRMRPARGGHTRRSAPEPEREWRRAARAEAGYALLLSLRYVPATSAACVGSAPARPADQVS